MDRAIEHKIDMIGDKLPLDIARVDLTLVDPERLRAKLGPTFEYFQRVETLTMPSSLEALMPASKDDYTGRFISPWTRDEQVHGKAFNLLLGELGMSGIVDPEDSVPRINHYTGLVTARSEWAHGVVEMLYHTMGSLHEKLTAIGYKRLEQILTHMGETALVETLIKPIQKDEAVHLGYYRTVARHLGQTLSKRQIWLAQNILTKTYAPVGAGATSDKISFGHVLGTLAEGDAFENMTETIQMMADDAFQKNDRTAAGFVKRAMQECLDLVEVEDAPA